jgi:hypothetical protein
MLASRALNLKAFGARVYGRIAHGRQNIVDSAAEAPHQWITRISREKCSRSSEPAGN